MLSKERGPRRSASVANIQLTASRPHIVCESADIKGAFLRLRVNVLGVGGYSPPYRPLLAADDAEVVDLINAAQPDWVWVGLGTGKQKRWMAEHREVIEAPVMIGVRAAFDFVSGHKSQAPKWRQRSGVEWLYFLASEPRRLWRRYAQYPIFVGMFLGPLLGIKKKYEMEA